jgi:hypothetical protein
VAGAAQHDDHEKRNIVIASSGLNRVGIVEISNNTSPGAEPTSCGGLRPRR